MSRDCEHGQLARSCNICDLERELKAVTQQRDKLLAALEEISNIARLPDDPRYDPQLCVTRIFSLSAKAIKEVKGSK